MDKYMTKFEKAKILGYRADQISKGAPPTVDITGLTDAFTIAEKELKEGKIPLKIHRRYPNGEVVKIPVREVLCASHTSAPSSSPTL
jgi:DNA-directed RNA polymerase I, II, and III subunit RPABC2